MEDHPNLSPEINAALRSLDTMTGLFLNDLPVGYRAEVKTKNHTYLCSREGNIVGGMYDGYRVNGSTFGGSMIRPWWVGKGMYLELQRHPRVVTTSEIQEVNIVKEDTRD